MPPTKSFNQLAQNRAVNDPEFAAALLREAADTPPLTMREALRQIWQAASYPIRGNEDWCSAAIWMGVRLDRRLTRQMRHLLPRIASRGCRT